MRFYLPAFAAAFAPGGFASQFWLLRRHVFRNFFRGAHEYLNALLSTCFRRCFRAWRFCFCAGRDRSPHGPPGTRAHGHEADPRAHGHTRNPRAHGQTGTQAHEQSTGTRAPGHTDTQRNHGHTGNRPARARAHSQSGHTNQR